MPLLEVGPLSGGYGDADVFTDVSFSLGVGEIVTLAGTNGSGKSSLVKAILGLLPRTRGSVRFDGAEIAGWSVGERARRGIGYVPQVANVFPSLTVHENLQVIGVDDQRQRIAETYAAFPALEARKRNRAGSLSGGERQQLAIARVLISRPRLIILDEPTANLSPLLVNQVFDIIQRLPSPGVGVLLVEQRAREALAISARGIIMEAGRVCAAGPARELLADGDLARRFLGQYA
ncbi:MAG: ABC transporter ATP-binding protein [Rhizobiaceae bacterium]|nr:ABC transporter ATP-binding protein [Rhizobiaceae bacterium]